MNLVPHAPLWLLAILFAAMAAAAIEDFIRLRISNITCAAVFVAALVAMGLEGFSLVLWENAAVFAFLLICGTFLFATGKFGGGDVKLFAALGPVGRSRHRSLADRDLAARGRRAGADLHCGAADSRRTEQQERTSPTASRWSPGPA